MSSSTLAQAFQDAAATKLAAVKGTPNELMVRHLARQGAATTAPKVSPRRTARTSSQTEAQIARNNKVFALAMVDYYSRQPCTVDGYALTWAVTGSWEDKTSAGAGVLAWCLDGDEARKVYNFFLTSGKYDNLRVENLA